MDVNKRIEDLKWFSAARALTREEAWWLIEQAEQAEQLQKDVDFFKKRQEINTQITQDLISLNDVRVKEILTKTRGL